jgi:hypothetical protein
MHRQVIAPMGVSPPQYANPPFGKACERTPCVHVRSALRIMTASGLKPNRDIAFHVLRGCLENKRPDLAVAFCRWARWTCYTYHARP